MSEKKTTPKPGEVWQKKSACGQITACFIYQDGVRLRRAWMGAPWSPDIVPSEEMVDGENGWKQVYKPPTNYSGLFTPLHE